ncbi:MAG: DUF6607 family protein [Pseudomonadota bacterium]
MKIAIFLSVIFLVVQGQAGDFEKQRDSILGMAGCYDVRFQFAETFPRTKGYVTQKPYFSGALEWVEVDVDQNDQIELQHLLIVGPNRVIKHWRQEWTYEAQDRFAFKGDKVWEKEAYSASKVTGAWEQNVLQVDDSPRYECSGQWVINDGTASYWECEAWNPLPRREFSTRNDYNVLKRRNRHQIFPDRWIHEQDNEKIIAKGGKMASILTEEKGKNLYVKVADSKCQAAKVWWADNKSSWESIRQAWDQIYGVRTKLAFKKMPQPLWQLLWGLSEQAQTESWNAAKTQGEAFKVIESYLE